MWKTWGKTLVLSLALLSVWSPVMAAGHRSTTHNAAVMQRPEPESEQGETPLADEVPGYQKLYGTIKGLDASHRTLLLTPEMSNADVKLMAAPSQVSGFKVGDKVTVEAIGNELQTIEAR